jgi:hypothetical protein
LKDEQCAEKDRENPRKRAGIHERLCNGTKRMFVQMRAGSEARVEFAHLVPQCILAVG